LSGNLLKETHTWRPVMSPFRATPFPLYTSQRAVVVFGDAPRAESFSRRTPGLAGWQRFPPPRSKAVTSATGGKSFCGPKSCQTWLWLVSLFLTGLGAKLWLIGRCGTALPFWDHWEEATVAYMPFLDGRLSWLDLFKPHSEHRPFFTRVYGLALLLLNGQWDAQLEMVGDAFLHTMVIAGLGWLAARQMGAQCRPWLWLPLAAMLCPPFAWENTLGGFQSQFYFMLLFSLATLWLLGCHRSGSRWWWLGVVTGICALFTVASGFLAGTAVFSFLLLKILRRRDNWQQYVPTLAVCTVLTLTGLVLEADVPIHRVLMAHSLRDFLTAFCNNLAWPWIVVPPFAILNCLPLLILGWRYLRSREADMQADELVLSLGFWTILSAAATAYARGAGGALPQWRYMDTNSFVLIANALAILILLDRWRGRPRLRRFLGVAALAWALVNAAGLVALSARAWQLDIPEARFYWRRHLRSVRAFLATDDMHDLAAKGIPQRPLIFPNRLAWILRDPDIRSRLPACARDPLPVAPAAGATNVFVPRGWNLRKPDPPTEVSWGSYNAQGAAATGVFESQPVRASRFPYLQIEVAGDLGQPGLSLELVDSATKERIQVKPRFTPGTGWEACEIKAPKGDFTIVATDNSPTGWFAFKQPCELARLSYWNGRLLSLGPAMFFCGLGLYAAGLILRVRDRRARAI
jgi:hypothetical protein